MVTLFRSVTPVTAEIGVRHYSPEQNLEFRSVVEDVYGHVCIKPS